MNYENAQKLLEELVENRAIVRPYVAALNEKFEQRKAAWTERNISSSKGSKINLKKLATYQINDNIFNQKVHVQEGNRHGLMIHLDWSSSMNRMLQSVVMQGIALAEFCRNADIPFRVFLFKNGDRSQRTDEYIGSVNQLDTRRRDESYNNPDNIFSLDVMQQKVVKYRCVEIFSSKQSKKDFEDSCKMLYLIARGEEIGYGNNVHLKYTTTATPLISALNYSLQKAIPQFRADERLDSETLLIITDGDPSDDSFGSLSQVTMPSGRSWNPAMFKAYTTGHMLPAFNSELRSAGSRVVYINLMKQDKVSDPIIERASNNMADVNLIVRIPESLFSNKFRYINNRSRRKAMKEAERMESAKELGNVKKMTDLLLASSSDSKKAFISLAELIILELTRSTFGLDA